MDLHLKDKRALITGSSRGLGYATALALSREGCRVAINSRNDLKVAEAAKVIATLEAGYREERLARQQEWRREQESRRALDAEIDRLAAGIRLLVAAALLDNGYHTHKGQWRSRYEQQAIHRAERAETAP